jgi:hypothetical protein
MRRRRRRRKKGMYLVFKINTNFITLSFLSFSSPFQNNRNVTDREYHHQSITDLSMYTVYKYICSLAFQTLIKPPILLLLLLLEVFNPKEEK